jgi:uncharacterized membrane protein YqjE
LLDIFQKWKDKISTLVETKVRLMQLEFIERASGVLSFLIFIILFILLGFAVFLFAGLGIAECLSELMDSYILGYLTVAGSFLLLGFIFFAFRKKIIRNLSDKFVSVLTEKREDEDEEEEEDSTAKSNL